MDAGFARLDRPQRRVTLEQIVGWTSRLIDFIARPMLVRRRIDNTRREALDPWIRLLHKARPACVQLYIIDRLSADARLLRVSREELQRIAGLVTARTGIRAVVYS